LAFYFALVLGLVALVLALSWALGERHTAEAMGDPYESGIVPVQPARLRLNVKFYIVAMMFVIFDLESVYLLSWAVIARDAGWPPLIEAAIFVAVLLAGLAYLWRIGGLDWGTLARRRAASGRQELVQRSRRRALKSDALSAPAPASRTRTP
jgi:NADH-quinone oxidoreductase subunit A